MPAFVNEKDTAFVKKWQKIMKRINNPQNGYIVEKAILYAFCELRLLILYVLPFSR